MSNLHIWCDNAYLYGENFEENIIYILWSDNWGEAPLGNYSEYYDRYFGITVSDEYSYFPPAPNDTIDIYKLQNTDEAVYSFMSDVIESEELVYIGSLTFNNNFEYYATPIISNIGNKTISSLYINNKEVQSIITNNNVVLYEKENSVTPVVSEPYSISLSASKYILSEYDTDTCVLSATVTDENNNVCGNQTVTFKSDNTILSTATTDNNGVATYTYNSQGIGDVYASAETNNLSSNSILIEDCMYFKEEEVSYVSTYTSGDHSIRLDDNLSLVLTDDFEFSMDCKANMNGARLQLSSIAGASSSTTNYGFGFNCDSGGICPYYRDTTSLAWDNTKISNDTNYHSLKFVRDGNTFTAHIDDINKGNQTFTWWNSKSPFSLYWWVWKSGTITAKNIKIKKIIHSISPVNILDNVSFTHSDGTASRDVSYMNNESTTMNVQGFEDANTIAINGEIDFLLGTGEDYRDITLTPNVEYDFTGYDFDIIQLNYAGKYSGNALSIGDKTILYDAADGYGLSGLYTDGASNFQIKDGKIYCCNNNTKYVTPSNLKVTAFASNIIIRIYNCINNYSLIGTQTTNNQGYASYEYEATGQGEFYIKAQSHNDSTVATNDYLISDWIYKDFTNYGGWSAFSGRNTSSMSISNNTLSVTSGNKGGAHSVNTIFSLPNDDYEVSFKITETTKANSNGVRIGIHSANYSDHHEKACCGIAYTGESSNSKISFDVSNNDVTAVTKTTIGDNLAVGDIIRFRVEGTTLKCYHNDSLYVTETLAWLHDPIWLYCQSWGSGTSSMSITDFRVKRIINN